MPSGRSVVAVSATKLQGIYVYPDVLPFYRSLRAAPPREILGESIYLYDWPLEHPQVAGGAR